MSGPPTDPVRARRAQIQRLTAIGQRIGAGLYAVAIVVFVAAFFAGFTSTTVSIVVACLVGGSVVLAPSIVVAYAAKAAEREDRERGL